MENMEAMKFCQSCGMPMENEKYGNEADGTESADYCQYCYKDGKFVGEMTMEQMVDACIPHVKDMYPTAEEAKQGMMKFFPQLKRWASA